MKLLAFCIAVILVLLACLFVLLVMIIACSLKKNKDELTDEEKKDNLT